MSYYEKFWRNSPQIAPTVRRVIEMDWKPIKGPPEETERLKGVLPISFHWMIGESERLAISQDGGGTWQEIFHDPLS